MNNPFEYIPAEECRKAFSLLIAKLDILRKSSLPEDIRLCRELKKGKMLGVLIATDDHGTRHTLYAFSGQLGEGGFHHPLFVEPVFDYLLPGGYFKTHEADISRQNREIERFVAGRLAEVRRDYETVKQRLDAEVADFREKCRQSKQRRAERRETGLCSEAELAEMIRTSQFEKAELHRLKRRAATELEPFAAALKEAQAHLEAMKEKRRSDSEALQNWLFTNFTLLNARGESRPLSEIFASTVMRIPPSGAGECCAPKLLQAAYRRGWHPESMAEYWYGMSGEGEVRIHGEHYPACRGKCLPVLTWMLQGLHIEPPLGEDNHAGKDLHPEIIYENRWFCVVDKPSGMLSVPGKGDAISVQEWLEERYGKEKEVKMAHRLDQDTSGLLVATFGEVAYKVMQRLFSSRQTRKTYIAELEGDYTALGHPESGHISLPLSPDWLDRPRQKIDFKTGKEALTDYRFVSVGDGHSRIELHPLTGRTHQLRVHTASETGLGMPIVGDRLYGKKGMQNGSRLLLHAHKLEFRFPIDREDYRFESPVPF